MTIPNLAADNLVTTLLARDPHNIQRRLLERGGVWEVNPFTGQKIITLLETPNESLLPSHTAPSRALLLRRSTQPKELPTPLKRYLLHDRAKPKMCPWCGDAQTPRSKRVRGASEVYKSHDDTILNIKVGGCYHYDPQNGARVCNYHIYCRTCRRTDDWTAARLEKVCRFPEVKNVQKIDEKGRPLPEVFVDRSELVTGWMLADENGDSAPGYGPDDGYEPDEMSVDIVRPRAVKPVVPAVSDESLKALMETKEGRERVMAAIGEVKAETPVETPVVPPKPQKPRPKVGKCSTCGVMTEFGYAMVIHKRSHREAVAPPSPAPVAEAVAEPVAEPVPPVETPVADPNTQLGGA